LNHLLTVDGACPACFLTAKLQPDRCLKTQKKSGCLIKGTRSPGRRCWIKGTKSKAQDLLAYLTLDWMCRCWIKGARSNRTALDQRGQIEGTETCRIEYRWEAPRTKKQGVLEEAQKIKGKLLLL